jgi:hypothetical protein
MQTMQWRNGAMRLGMVCSLVLLEALPAAAAAGQVPGAGADNHMLIQTASRRSRSNKAPCKSSGLVYPNGETYSQRERRLMRECRGLPNAGACRGYGQ